MKKILKFISVMCMIIIVSTLSGCGYTREQKQAYKKYEREGKENAVRYIEEKYDFEAKVIKVTAVSSFGGNAFDFSTDPSGEVVVEMIHDSRFFMVYMNYKESDKCYDSYQQYEINEDIKNMVYETTNIKVEDLYLDYGKSCKYPAEYHSFINEYYDGNNLYEILENYYSVLNAVIGTFDDLDDNNIKNINIPDNILKDIIFAQYEDGDYIVGNSMKMDSSINDENIISIAERRYLFKDAKLLLHVPGVEEKMNIVKEYKRYGSMY